MSKSHSQTFPKKHTFKIDKKKLCFIIQSIALVGCGKINFGHFIFLFQHLVVLFRFTQF